MRGHSRWPGSRPPVSPRCSGGGQRTNRLPAAAGNEPRASQRAFPFQQAPARDQQGKSGPRPVHLLPRHAQEVGGRDVVVEDDQDGGLRAVVVGGAVGGVVDEAPEPQQSLFSWAEFMAGESVKPRGRNRKPQPASLSMFEWALRWSRRERKSRSARDAKPISRGASLRAVVPLLSMCGLSCYAAARGVAPRRRYSASSEQRRRLW